MSSIHVLTRARAYKIGRVGVPSNHCEKVKKAERFVTGHLATHQKKKGVSSLFSASHFRECYLSSTGLVRNHPRGIQQTVDT